MPELSLTLSCGCREMWQVVSVPPDFEQHRQRDYPCFPDICRSCAERGEHCTARESRTGIHAYTPVEWSEISGGPRRVTRMRGTGSRAWERTA